MAVRPSRFWPKVDKRAGDACWQWTGGRNAKGYGTYSHGLAHRFAYEMRFGPVPDGLQLDHLCRNRLCVNPDHLDEPVTCRENVRRGVARAALNARKTHCDHGHEFTPENTHVRPCGRRACRACARESTRRYVARKQAA